MIADADAKAICTALQLAEMEGGMTRIALPYMVILDC
jgi:hypothetical protein